MKKAFTTKRYLSTTAVMSIMLLSGGNVLAADVNSENKDWYVRVGLSKVAFDSSADVKLNGSPVAGGSANASDSWTATFEGGYFVWDNIAASLTVGSPPLTKISGRGVLGPFGTLGKVTYGPATLTAHYHLRQIGAFQPYLGGGIAYATILGTDDASLSGLKVNGDFGSVFQAGFDYMLTSNWAMSVDVKKLWLGVDAKATVPAFGGLPTSARVTLDPIIATLGITYRF